MKKLALSLIISLTLVMANICNAFAWDMDADFQENETVEVVESVVDSSDGVVSDDDVLVDETFEESDSEIIEADVADDSIDADSIFDSSDEEESESEGILGDSFTIEEISLYDGEISADGVTNENLLGVWEGTYTGHSGSTPIVREIKLNIDSCDVDGYFEGFAEIDQGTNGIYFLKGNMNIETGEISFWGDTWLSNQQNLSFSDFTGSFVNTSLISGIVSGNSNQPFEIRKTSDVFVSYRLDMDTLQCDWEGEYDGTDGYVVVRRDYEIHITDVDEQGNISGKAIIHPSSKASAVYGANGSYIFNGTVDFRTGKIQLQGTEWIDYPVSSSTGNWSFVYLEGFIERFNNTISGISDNGIWEMHAIDYDVQKESGFVLGRDNNNFVHTSNKKYSGAGFVDVTDYTIDDDYFNKLTQNSSKGEKNRIKKLMKDPWEGSCYGISSTMGLVYEHYLSIGNISSDAAANYHEMSYPTDDSKLLNTINYYQLSQFLSNGGKSDAAVSTTYNYGFISGFVNWLKGYDSISVFLQKLVKQAESGHVALLGYGYSGGGHAILVTGCSFDKKQNKYEVQLYDMNSVYSATDDGFFTSMTIDKDFSAFKLVTPSGKNITKDNFSNMFFLDWRSMAGLIDGTTGNKLNSRQVMIDVPSYSSFTITGSNGAYLSYDGSKFSGTMKIYDVINAEDDNESHYIFYTDACEDYVVSQTSGSVDVNISSLDDFVSLEGTGIEDATLSFDNGIEIEGNDYSFEAFLSTDNEIGDNENGLISVSGNAKDTVILEREDDSVSVSSDTEIGNLSMSSYTGTQSRRTDFGSDQKQATITDSGQTEPEEHSHSWGEWKTVKNPSAVSVGKKERVCTICNEKETQDIPKLKATIKTNVSSIVLQVKKSTSKVKVSNLAYGDSIKSWKSANTSIVTVNKKGKIKAKNKVGKTTVTITLKSGLKKKISVRVQKGKVKTTKIKNVKKKISLKKGESVKLKPALSPITSSDKITYTSSNKKVASVNKKGTIKAKKKGKATITVKSGNKKVTCKITVK